MKNISRHTWKFRRKWRTVRFGFVSVNINWLKKWSWINVIRHKHTRCAWNKTDVKNFLIPTRCVIDFCWIMFDIFFMRYIAFNWSLKKKIIVFVHVGCAGKFYSVMGNESQEFCLWSKIFSWRNKNLSRECLAFGEK